jgi:hypothetical protein
LEEEAHGFNKWQLGLYTSVKVTLIEVYGNKAMAKTVPQAQFVVNAQGKKTGVLLSLKQYQKLLEDLHDLAVIAERRNEEPISLEEMQRRLYDGVV